ncbi:hypothetical protein D9M72_570090 [compost metagenome]
MSDERHSKALATKVLRDHDHFDKSVSEEMVGQHTIGSDGTVRFDGVAAPCLDPRPDVIPSLRIVSGNRIEGDQRVEVGKGGTSDFHQRFQMQLR